MLDSPPLHIDRQRNGTIGIRARSASVRISQSRGDDDLSAAGIGRLRSMLIGKGASWKAARARLHPTRHLWHTLRSGRTLLGLALLTTLVWLWQSTGSNTMEMPGQRCAFSIKGHPRFKCGIAY